MLGFRLRAAYPAMSLRVTPGVSRPSPAATTRMARMSSAAFSVLHEESGGTGPQALEHILVVLKGGQDDHVNGGESGIGGDQPGGLHAVEFRHSDIHEQHVGTSLLREVDRFEPVAGLSDDRYVLFAGQESREPAADQGLVVCEGDPDHPRRSLRGSLARPRKPPRSPGRQTTKALLTQTIDSV